MARKNPAPAAITNSVFLVSGMVDPPQRPRAGTLFRLDLGSFVALRRGLPFRVAGTLPQGDDVAGPDRIASEVLPQSSPRADFAEGVAENSSLSL
jgi:hypothetical protein